MSQKILIVDDEPEILKLVSEGLADVGFEVVSAATGGDGIAKANQEHPALIILDIHLPDIDGVTLYRELRQTEFHQKTPVIFLTGLAQGTPPVLAGIHDTAYTIIAKPVGLEELQKEIVRLLN